MDIEIQSIARSSIRKLIMLEELKYVESSFIPANETDEQNLMKQTQGAIDCQFDG